MTESQTSASTRDRLEPPPETLPEAAPDALSPAASPFSREVRLGLVLYGGVSLAIYINGVTQEFARAVRGQRGYRLVKALTDSDVIVDVVSGTSAGGINGLALSFALCNGFDLAALPLLWREDGDIAGLLHLPDDNDPPINSLLSSTAYQQKLRSAFEDLAATPFTADEGLDDYVSPTSELDLFVTGTYMEGFQRVAFDDRGHAMRVEDHRALFKLKHRELRSNNPDLCMVGKDPDERATLVDALAKLARITSCFPSGFPPVRVNPITPRKSQMTVDGMLHRWGQLPDDTQGYFVDGGVLDNKPFTSTLGAIFSRPATREVNRALFFVEPDPAEFRRPESDDGGQAPVLEPPTIAETLLRARIDIPFVETITDDLKRLADHNRGLALYERISADLRRQWFRNFQHVPEDEKTSMAQEVAATLVSPAQVHTYRRSRLVEFSQRIAQTLYDASMPSPETTEQELSECAAAFIRYFDTHISRDEVMVEWLLTNDIYFYRRRIYYLIYMLHSMQFGDSEQAGIPEHQMSDEQLLMLRIAMNRQAELYEVLRTALASIASDAPTSWKQAPPETIWALLVETSARLLDTANAALPDEYEALLYADSKSFSDALSLLNAKLRTAVDALHALRLDSFHTTELRPTTRQLPLISRLTAIERNAIRRAIPNDEMFEPIYEAFERLDAALFPLEVVGRLGEKDNVEIVRISAIDAQRGFSQRKLQEKLSGDSVMHFGGFFKRSWRSNDILWGRLDGCCQLMEFLLDPERVKQMIQDPVARRRLHRRFFDTNRSPGVEPNGAAPWKAGMRPADLFPHAGARTQQTLEAWLRAICEGTLDVSSPTWKSDFDTNLTLLIEAEQLEILYEEVPNVIVDALAEQVMWNRYEFAFPGTQPLASSEVGAVLPVMNGDDSPRFVDIGSRRIDPFVAITAAAHYVYRAAGTVFTDPPDRRAATPADTRMGRFFKEQYRVGEERLTHDIPNVVLLGLMARTLLVLRTCLLNMFGDSADRVRHSLLYRLGIDLPLRAFYGFTLLWRRWAGARTAAFIGLAGISALLLVIGVWFWDELIASDTIDVSRLLVFIVVPGLVLFVLVRALVLGWAFTRAWRVVLYSVLTVGLAAALIWGLAGTRDALESVDWSSRTTLQILISAVLLYTVTRAVFWRIINAIASRI